MKLSIHPGLAVLLIAAPASAFQAQALLAHYDLDETSGRIAHDTSTNIQDGDFMPSVELGLPGAQPATGHSARFRPGQEAHASIGAAPGLGLLRSNVSLAAWVNPESIDGIMRIFSNADSGWSCAVTPSGLRLSVRYVQDFVADCDVPLNQWSHVAFVFDAGFDATMYLNGQNLGTANGIWPAYAPGPEWHVGSLDGETDFWNGKLDDVQVYAGALTPSEVTWLYSNPGQVIDPMVGTPYCFGDGHSTPCPCFNYGDHDGGCINSTGDGARLQSSGSNSAEADDLAFSVDRLPANQPALLFVGNNATNDGKGNVFGDGLRCAGGAVRRLGVKTTDATGSAEWAGNLRESGGWDSGDTQRFQTWYRDPVSGPCGTGFNLSQGIQVVFAP